VNRLTPASKIGGDNDRQRGCPLPMTGLERAMSTIRGFALPVPWVARDQKLVKPTAILAAILRSFRARSERRGVDRAVPAGPSGRPSVPTSFPFDVRDFVGEGRARQRSDRGFR